MVPEAFPTRLHQEPGLRLPGWTGGFSLLELLIVVALIFVLSTLYFGGGSRSYQLRKMGECERNLQNIFVALGTYAADNKGQFPAPAGAKTSEGPLSLLVPRYTTSTEPFICPGSKDAKLADAKAFGDARISYAYYMGHTAKDGGDQPLMSDRQVNTNSKAPADPVFSSDGRKPGNNHNKYGGIVMFCDGAVQPCAAFASFALSNGSNITLLNPRP